MREYGHLVPEKRPPGEDIFGHAAWRTPSIPELDENTLLYVRESIAGILAVDRGRPFIDALPLIDEIIRLRRAALAATPTQSGAEGPAAEALSSAMNEAYTYDDRDNSRPTLPFIDDGEAFWDPFAAKVAAALRFGAEVAAAPGLDVEALRKAIAELPQPTLGMAGGVNRSAVIDAIDRLVAAGPTEVPPARGLSEAWAAAEAVLPERWRITEMANRGRDWRVIAELPGFVGAWESGIGAEPAAALLALAARLTAKP